MIKFDCILKMNENQQKWIGKIKSFTDHSCFYEINVDDNSAGMRVIFGNSESGNFICLPEYGVSCGSESFSDPGHNYEKLVPLIGEMKAITVSQALNKMSEVLF